MSGCDCMSMHDIVCVQYREVDAMSKVSLPSFISLVLLFLYVCVCVCVRACEPVSVCVCIRHACVCE
ncbi:MAG: hypothetical protein P4L40_05105 [Terracidiphilus sp.]|nr:hypothetical protein [Terracidiphilus sp.]